MAIFSSPEHRDRLHNDIFDPNTCLKLVWFYSFIAGFDYALLKPIPSKYTVGKGFLDKWTPDGKTTNVSTLLFESRWLAIC